MIKMAQLTAILPEERRQRIRDCPAALQWERYRHTDSTTDGGKAQCRCQFKTTFHTGKTYTLQAAQFAGVGQSRNGRQGSLLVIKRQEWQVNLFG